MKTLGYHLNRALKSLWSRPASLLLTLGSVALSFGILGGVFLLAQNLSRLTDDWGSGATVAVDLVHATPPADVARIRQAIRETEGVSRVRRVDPGEAKQRLMRHLGQDAEVVADVEESFLPSSFEITLSGDRRTVIAAQRRLTRMAGVVPGVEAVQTVEAWFHSLTRLVGGLRLAGGVLGMLVLFACAYIIMATIRLRFYDRKQELQVLQLMGATHRFIRAPFLIEGLFQGLTGAGLALGLLYALFALGVTRVELMFGATVPASRLAFLPANHALCGLGVGALCGLIGAWVATRRTGDV